MYWSKSPERTVMEKTVFRTFIPAIIHYYASNQAHLKPFEPSKNDDFYTEGYWRSEVQKRLDAFHADQCCKLLLFEKEIITEVIGIINFAHFVRGAFQACTLGYSVAGSKEGKGYMSEALEVAIRYVFNELKMHRIMAAYMPANQRRGMADNKVEYALFPWLFFCLFQCYFCRIYGCNVPIPGKVVSIKGENLCHAMNIH